MNLLLDVGFNREDTAIYWDKMNGSLSGLIDYADKISMEKREKYGEKAKQRIQDAYSWQFVGEQYRRLWNKGSI